jgi:serine/threonine protein kinase
LKTFAVVFVDPLDELKRVGQILSQDEYRVLTANFPSETVLLTLGKLSAEASANLVTRVRLQFKTATIEQLYTINGFTFAGRMFIHQDTVYMVKVSKGTHPFVAKITREDLQQEFKFSQEVHEGQVCPTVMRAKAAFKVDEHRFALVTPAFPMTVHELGACRNNKFPESIVANITICTLSTIKAFANKGLAHCDLKPKNLMLDSNGLVVAIDFGSVRRVGDAITSTTPLYDCGVPFDKWYASTLFDLRFLGSMIASFALGLREYAEFKGSSESTSKNDGQPVESKHIVANLLELLQPSLFKSLALICLTVGTVDEAWEQCKAAIKSKLPDSDELVDPASVWPVLSE